MASVTQILEAIEHGDPQASAQLLPLVYDELRKLAAARLAREKPGQTLQPTALVHEAYLRLLGGDQSKQWNSRAHFFGAAAEAMRRILVDLARKRKAVKHGGQGMRVPLSDLDGPTRPDEEVLAVDEALDRLANEDSTAAAFIKYRYFAGMTAEEAAEALGISRSRAFEHWAYARARLRCLLPQDE